MAHISKTIYIRVFIALMLLLGATVGMTFFNLGPFNLAMAIIIAMSKSLLILLFFMHVRYSSPLTRLFAAAGFFWLFTLILLSMSDYFTRGWIPRGGG